MADTIFHDKTLLITGGTGSFGHTVLKHFLTTDIGEIRIFSRDEKKQDDMRHELQANYPEYYQKVKFYIGDVRNIQSLRDVMPGVDYIFHAAALKQVPSCEFFPMEAVRTNIEGTDNMLHAAIPYFVRHCRLKPAVGDSCVFRLVPLRSYVCRFTPAKAVRSSLWVRKRR